MQLAAVVRRLLYALPHFLFAANDDRSVGAEPQKARPTS
jgi:hypothetical protein